MFYLLAALAYLRFKPHRARAPYFLATACFILALLSKSVTATLPAALLVQPLLRWCSRRTDRCPRREA